MGKSSRSKRFGAFKPSPTGLLSEKDLELSIQLEGDHLSQNVPGIIATVLEKLQAPSVEERTCGCQLMASIVCQPKAIDLLLKHNIVKITAPLFLDASADVQKNALGALRNMSVYGEEKVCDVMLKEDVFTPLSSLIKQFGNGWVPAKEAGKQATQSLIEAVELASNLCENSTKALQRFTSEGLTTILLPMLQVNVYDYPLSCAVARCLHIVSENNPDVLKLLQQPDVVTGLGNIVMTKPPHVSGVLFQVLSAGVILNLTDVDLSPYFDGVVQMAGLVLDTNCLPLLHTALEKVKKVEQNKEYDPEVSWLEVDQLLSAQSICLELLANMCCSDEEWEEMEDGPEEDMSDDQAPASTHAVHMEEEGEAASGLSSEVHSALTRHNILSKVATHYLKLTRNMLVKNYFLDSAIKKFCQILEKAMPSLESEQESQLQGSKSGKLVLEKLEDLECRALLCLSNVISALDQTTLSQCSVAVQDLWSRLYSLGKMQRGGRASEDWRWAITCAMRAVLQRMAELHPNEIKSVTDSDLLHIVGFASQCQNTDVQINVTKIMSIIGCVLATDAGCFPLLKCVGNMLLQALQSSQNLIVTAEALDAIFDVFKEDETDGVATQISLVDKLNAFHPTFKAKVSSERKKLGEHYGVVMMAKTNLTGFLKYKASKR